MKKFILRILLFLFLLGLVIGGIYLIFVDPKGFFGIVLFISFLACISWMLTTLWEFVCDTIE